MGAKILDPDQNSMFLDPQHWFRGCIPRQKFCDKFEVCFSGYCLAFLIKYWLFLIPTKCLVFETSGFQVNFVFEVVDDKHFCCLKTGGHNSYGFKTKQFLFAIFSFYYLKVVFV